MQKISSTKKLSQSVTLVTDKLWIGDPTYVISKDYKCSEDKLLNDCIIGTASENIGLAKAVEAGIGEYEGDSGQVYPVNNKIIAIIDLNKCNDSLAVCGRTIDVENGEHEVSLNYNDGEVSFYVDGTPVEVIDVCNI